MKNIVVIGGAGYVGVELCSSLLLKGYNVHSYDLMLYGNCFNDQEFQGALFTKTVGDLRNLELLRSCLGGVDIIIHLACISNDPSYDLDPELSRSINYDSFRPLVELSKSLGVKRFIYASSSSVYGVKSGEVNENCSLSPLTDYSYYKMKCESILNEYSDDSFTTVSIRPATVCGFSRRQRLDVIVNILTNFAYHKREVNIFGGEQLRPNIHIQDMVEAYELLCFADSSIINGESFNAGESNHSVSAIGAFVKKGIGEDVVINVMAVQDERSYHISSKKILDYLDFKPIRTISDAVKELRSSFEEKILVDTFNDEIFYNIRRMQSVKLK